MISIILHGIRAEVEVAYTRGRCPRMPGCLGGRAGRVHREVGYEYGRAPYILDYTYPHLPLQSLSSTLTLIGVDVLTPDVLHLGAVFF